MLTMSADTELTKNTTGVFIRTSEASATDVEGIPWGTNHSSMTKTTNSNVHHNDNDISSYATASTAITTEESIRTSPGDSEISEISSTVSSTPAEKAGTLQSTNYIGVENTDMASSTIRSKTSVTSSRYTSESPFTSTSTSTTSHVVSTNTVTNYTSTISTHHSNHEDMQNVTVEGSLTRSTKTSTTQNATIPPSDSQMSTNKAEIKSSSTEKSVTAPKENSDVRTFPVRVTSPSDTVPSNRGQTVLIETSTSTVIKENITTGLGYPSTTLYADESNKQHNNNATTNSSGTNTTNASNGESMEIPTGDSHIPDIASTASNYSTEKTTTTKVSDNESTKIASETSKSATIILQQTNSTTNAVTTSPKASTSTSWISTATGKHNRSRNTSDNTNEHQNNHGFTEGSTVQFFSTSTEQNTRVTSTDSRKQEREKNASSSHTIETTPLQTVNTAHEAHTHATKTSTSVSAASYSEITTYKSRTDETTTSTDVSASSISETSNSSRAVEPTTSEAATFTDNTAVATDHVSKTATNKSSGLDSDNGNRQTSTTRSFVTSTQESTKRASIDSHIPENTNVDSNWPTVELVTSQTTNITREPITDITASSNVTTASDIELTQNNGSVLMRTSAASASDVDSISTTTFHSSRTAAHHANIEHSNNATTASPATGSFAISTEQSTKMPRRDSEIPKTSSRVTTTSSGKSENAETTSATVLKNTGVTFSTVTSKSSILSLRNTSENVFTTTSLTSSTHVVSKGTAINDTTTSATDKTIDEDRENRTIEGSITNSTKTVTTESARTSRNDTSKISSSSTQKTVTDPTNAYESDQENFSEHQRKGVCEHFYDNINSCRENGHCRKICLYLHDKASK
ncbi:serine-rich adhesin for platelets-like [Rhipicephalus sanguineus]|uniref:serine-rich adhesin for platelets-like n=1 Tax=Rhipicephalus sanguineus TaxID=34632 RepID=UPI001893004F|nr:serine-rich adhesin for platelets-like [Rhipicephalus sanguineus]